MEEWKVAVESYEISNHGNCRRKLKNGNYKVIMGSLNQSTTSKNYKSRYFQLLRNGKRINYFFSHLVAKCFIGEKPEGLEIDHIDINPQNNHVSNLRYISHRENCLNQQKTIDIPEYTDLNDRKNKVYLKWEKENKNIILQKKKEYYQKDKTKWKIQNEKRKKDTVELICSRCNNSYNIQRRTLSKRKTTLCRACCSKNNLKL